MKFRFYVVTDEGLRRVPLKVLEERLAAPQLTAARQKAIEVLYEWRADRLYLKASGQYLSFDDRGVIYVPTDDLRTAMEVVSTANEIARERLRNSKVASLDLRRRDKGLTSELGWPVSQAELRQIEADLMGSDRPVGTSAIPVLKTTPI
jgi:hypothetical protein